MNKKILITGGAGYIGAVLCRKLIAAGFKLTVIDNLSGGAKENLSPEIQFYEMDILDPEIVKVIKKESPDLIFHMAALKSVDESLNDPLGFAKVNILGSINVIEAAKSAGVNKFVFMSTAGVYGDLVPAEGQTENQKLSPSSPYAASKLAIEDYLNYYNTEGLNSIIFRFANVYGTGGKSKVYGAIDKFISQVKNGENIVINGDGTQTRDFVYIEDLVDLCVTVAKNYPENLEDNFVFNVSTGKEESINEIVRLIKEITGINFKTKYDPLGNVGQLRSVLNSANTKKRLNWEAKTNIAEGIKQIV